MVRDHNSGNVWRLIVSLVYLLFLLLLLAGEFHVFNHGFRFFDGFNPVQFVNGEYGIDELLQNLKYSGDGVLSVGFAVALIISIYLYVILAGVWDHLSGLILKLRFRNQSPDDKAST